MWNVTAKVIPVIIEAMELYQNNADSIWATYRESSKLRNYRKQPYYALHIYCGKC